MTETDRELEQRRVYGHVVSAPDAAPFESPHLMTARTTMKNHSIQLARSALAPSRRAQLTLAGLGLIGLFSSTLAGCASKGSELIAPATLVAPYNTARGDVLWAVVPLQNESGTTEAAKSNISDKVVAACEEIQGVRCVPLNRTLEAMRALKLTSVRSAAEVRALGQAMGVDGIVVGAITAYDPYTPTLGLSLALFSRGGAMNPAQTPTLNPRSLQMSPSEGNVAASNAFREGPVATASENLDAKNNQVLMDLKQYAKGRLDGPSALGWRRYAASMELYSEFAASHLVGRLVQNEWIRLAGAVPGIPPAAASRPGLGTPASRQADAEMGKMVEREPR